MEDATSLGKQTTAKIQLAVDMSCAKCATDITMHLKSNKGIENIAVNLEKQTVILETALPTHQVVQLIEKTGKKALVTGVGAAGNQVANLGSAVAIMHEGNPTLGVRGVTRFVQSTMNTCVIDGTLDGLASDSTHRLAIHEFGDISDGCNSCGEIFDIASDNRLRDVSKPYGDLGNISSDENGCASFRIESGKIKVWDIIGRSMVVSSKQHGSGARSTIWTRLACGIIARSAGLFENDKKICACDGTTIWNEKKTLKAENSWSSQL